ncbi:MAG: hypothetical protein R2688_00205 [Fimbriimonadaceae bacterium]
MPPALIIFLILMVGLLLVGVIFMTIQISRLKKVIESTGKQISNLESRVTQQEAKLARIQAELESRNNDPLALVHESLAKFKKSGLASALGLLGSRLIQAYLKNKKTKSLPSKTGKRNE